MCNYNKNVHDLKNISGSITKQTNIYPWQVSI